MSGQEHLAHLNARQYLAQTMEAGVLEVGL
jgi:hypothetical protein